LKEFKQLAGQTIIYGLGTMLPRFLNYILLTVYFTNTLFADFPEEYGKVTELYAYIAFLMVLLTYGMETTFFRYVTKDGNKNKIFSTIQTILFITTVVFLITVLSFTQRISSLLDYQGEVYFIQLLAFILAVETVCAIPFAKLRIDNKPKKFALLKIIQVSVNIMFLLTVYNVIPYFTNSVEFLLNCNGIISSKFIFIANLIASSIVLLLLLPEFSHYRLLEFDKKLVLPLLIYGLPLMISGLAGIVNETLDRMIYKQLVPGNVGLAQLGIYGASFKIGALLLIFIQMFRYAAEPYFFNKSKDADSKTQYAALMNLFIGVVLAMGLVILLFLDVFQYFIGKNYREGLFVVPYIVLAYVFSGVLFNLSVWYKLSNKTVYALIIMLLGALITITINILYVPMYSYYASAVAHTISAIAMVVLSYLLSRRHYKVKYNLKRIGIYFALAFVIFFVDKRIDLSVTVLDFIFRGLLVLLFVTFVAWKEKLLPKIYSQ
jgi:O-antigen/teichoic acid export membrane protein